jgi:hypothetical protein
MPREYSQTAPSWNQQPSNYKSSSKPTMIQTGNYPQQSPYQLPPQQQFILGTYPYQTPTVNIFSSNKDYSHDIHIDCIYI